MLQAGLFDDSPHTREIIYELHASRALRVEVDEDSRWANFTLEQAAKYLEETVSMESGDGTSGSDRVFDWAGTGHYLSDRKTPDHQDVGGGASSTGEEFNLRAFHDSGNGNVPISLQRWEYLCRDDEVPK